MGWDVLYIQARLHAKTGTTNGSELICKLIFGIGRAREEHRGWTDLGTTDAKHSSASGLQNTNSGQSIADPPR